MIIKGFYVIREKYTTTQRVLKQWIILALDQGADRGGGKEELEVK